MKLVIPLILSLSLIACGGAVDNAEPPASLVDIEQTVNLKILNELDYGNDKSLFERINPLDLKSKIVFANSKGKVTVFNKKDFAIRWQKELNIAQTSAIGGNENAYLIATRDGEVVAVNPKNADILWKVSVSSEVLSSPVVAVNTVIVKTIDGKVTALNLKNGSQKWIYQRAVPALSVRGNSKPLVIEDKVITGLDNGKLVILNLKTGLPFWEKTITVPRGRSEIERLVDLDSDLIIRGSVIYIAGFQGRIVALDLTSGEFLWTKKMSVTRNMTIHDNKLYVTDNNSHIWALDTGNGGTLWKQTDFTARKLTSPVIIDDYLVVADYQGYIHVLAKADGHQAGRIQIDDSGVDTNPVAIGNKVFLQSRDSVIYVIGLNIEEL